MFEIQQLGSTRVQGFGLGLGGFDCMRGTGMRVHEGDMDWVGTASHIPKMAHPHAVNWQHAPREDGSPARRMATHVLKVTR